MWKKVTMCTSLLFALKAKIEGDILRQSMFSFCCSEVAPASKLVQHPKTCLAGSLEETVQQKEQPRLASHGPLGWTFFKSYARLDDVKSNCVRLFVCFFLILVFSVVVVKGDERISALSCCHG